MQRWEVAHGWSVGERSTLRAIVAIGALAGGCYPAASESARQDMVRAQAAKHTRCKSEAIEVTSGADFSYRAQGCGWETYHLIRCPETGCVAIVRNVSGPPDQPPPPGVVRGQRLVDVSVAPHALAVPPDAQKAEELLTGVFRWCISAGGEVYDVRVVETSGRHDLDVSWMRTIQTWQYRPYTRRGKPVRACLIDRVVALGVRGLDFKDPRLARSMFQEAVEPEVLPDTPRPSAP